VKNNPDQKEIVIDAFKEGDYPQGKFTATELAEIAETYNPDNYEAPVLIGHLSDPAYAGKTSIPAFGWIGKAFTAGSHLKLAVSQFSDELKTLIKGGYYKKVSTALFDPKDKSNPTPGKWHLHHLAFLGASAPQVKGLEGIAFAEIVGNGLEFAEVEFALEFDSIDDVEKAGTQDTLKDMAESCANFLKKAEAALIEDIDADTRKQRIGLAVSDLSNELCYTKDMHFTFMDKLENVEEHNEAEMSEKKNKLLMFAMRLITPKQRKDKSDMDQKKEEQYQKEIADQKAQLLQFAEEKRVADEKAVKEKQEQADVKLKTDVHEFCVKEKLDTKKHTDMNLEGILFAAAKANAEVEFAEGVKKPLLTVLQDTIKAFTLPTAPTGEMNKEFNEESKKEQSKESELIQKVDAYISKHPTEFAELPQIVARAKCIQLAQNNSITI
jgi:hypothetical protein